MRVDVHQHLWVAPFVDALSAREELPFGRIEGGRLVLHIAGEAPSAIDLDAERPDRRVELLAADGIDRALIAISSTIGIEALPRAEAQPLIDAFLDGILAAGAPFAAWGPVALDGACAADVDAVLARGCVGVSLPAGSLARPSGVEALSAVLDRLAELDAPLFVHPGPGRETAAAKVCASDPPWWPALTGYVAQMQAVWLAFALAGRRAHPRLRVIFAMLAGGAPLLFERLAARGGPTVDRTDPLSFYDTSSFGPSAIAAIGGLVGAGALLYGSDRPVVEPFPAARTAVEPERGSWLLERSPAQTRRLRG